MNNGIRYLKHGLLLGSALTAVVACVSMPESLSGIQTAYATPDMAVNALMQANRDGDTQKLVSILGPNSEKLISSGDAVADQEGRQKLISAYDKYHRLEVDGADKQILVVGSEQWPLPIPLVHGSDGWKWDTAEGEQSILDRRIGRNELYVIQVCREYVEAQHEFAALHLKRFGYSEYAQHINSSSGMHDGLYWPTKPHQMQSPFGPLMAGAQAEGYDKIGSRHEPFHGYYFRVLRKQGPNAAGGERDYMTSDDHMVKGFALLAYPATYGDSGIKSFIVNQNGIVYQTDLGADTRDTAAQIHAYDPGEGWQAVR
jgi:hypothetical protein